MSRDTLLRDHANAVHRLATFQAIDKLMPHDAPEGLRGEVTKAIIEARRAMYACESRLAESAT